MVSTEAPDPSGIRFVDPWRPLLSESERSAIPRQLAEEVTDAHPLWRLPLEVIGRHDGRDDMVIRAGDRFAIVHLSFGKGDSCFPRTRFYENAQALNDAMWKQAVMDGYVDEFDADDPRLWRDDP